LRNLVNYHGLRWSEALCFGLGAGLGFWLMDFPGASPSRFIQVRCASLEEQFFQRMGCPGLQRKFADPAEGEKELLALLDRGLPVLALTDLYYLPYFNSKTHFPGHAITIWGYDRKKEVFLVTDTEREEILEVSFAQMRRARFCRGPFFELEGNLYAPQGLAEPEDMAPLIAGAIAANSRALLESSASFQGMAALSRWGEEIRRWGSLPDWRWAARFCYQVIERRGTGGGGFRFLYADFLKEAVNYLPRLGLTPAEMMEEAGRAWQKLAYTLKEISQGEAPDFSPAAADIAAVYELETAYHRRILELELDLEAGAGE
jgi:hypothetical protein